MRSYPEFQVMSPATLPVKARHASPARRCPRHARVVLDGGPVLFHCQPYGHSVVAADIPHEFAPPRVKVAA